MKKPVVDYRQFRLRKLRDPEFSHLLLLLGWVVYFCLYFITENLIPVERCTPVWCPLDDVIPFCEYFIIPYVFWYALIVWSLLYFALYDTYSFRKLMTFIIVTQMTAMVIYIVFPNRQDLRPEFFARDNIFTKIIGLLYAFDTNTGVCPSLHVAYSAGIMSTWLKRRESTWMCKTFMVIVCLLISISVAFVKQHSVVDIYAAIPVCVLAEIIAFGKTWWYPRLRKKA